MLPVSLLGTSELSEYQDVIFFLRELFFSKMVNTNSDMGEKKNPNTWLKHLIGINRVRLKPSPKNIKK